MRRRRSLLDAVGRCCCCHRCCQPRGAVCRFRPRPAPFYSGPGPCAPPLSPSDWLLPTHSPEGRCQGPIRVYVNQARWPVLVALRPHRPLMPYRRRITIRWQSGGGSLQLPWSSGTRWSSSDRCWFPQSTAPMQEHQLGRLRLDPGRPALMQAAVTELVAW